MTNASYHPQLNGQPERSRPYRSQGPTQVATCSRLGSGNSPAPMRTAGFSYIIKANNWKPNVYREWLVLLPVSENLHGPLLPIIGETAKRGDTGDGPRALLVGVALRPTCPGKADWPCTSLPCPKWPHLRGRATPLTHQPPPCHCRVS